VNLTCRFLLNLDDDAFGNIDVVVYAVPIQVNIDVDQLLSRGNRLVFGSRMYIYVGNTQEARSEPKVKGGGSHGIIREGREGRTKGDDW
jgi:hypothetical protein